MNRASGSRESLPYACHLAQRLLSSLATRRRAMSTASSAGHEEGEAWLPLVVDCGVCETTHALAGGDRRACPFEGSQRARLYASGHGPFSLSDSEAVKPDPVTGRVFR
jgi:hypothetical protein